MNTSPESRAPESAPELKPEQLEALKAAMSADFTQYCIDGMTPDRGYAFPTDNVEKLLAAWNTRAPQAQKEEPQWLPISSAPKDGTEILVLEGGVVYHARWGGFRHPVWIYPPRAGIGFIDHATHWQPLPIPPKL